MIFSKEGVTTFGALVLVLALIGLYLWVMPVTLLWCLATLGLPVTLTFKTWLAAFLLIGIIRTSRTSPSTSTKK